MKQSTWRCFQRENELPLRWKSTRRDATSAGAGGAAAPSDSASDAIAIAVRIVRVNDVGLEPLDDAREAPRRRQVHLGARRNRNQLESFAGAAPQLAVGVRDERGPMADRAQAVDGQQHLILAAAPRPRRVDVEGEHVRVLGVRRSGARWPEVVPVEC